ncbi:DUF805 domain-containing protein [Paenibacillus sp. FA6]|uniref:DUF805 domain-containing protein n=1 Tax=Paenibacillus sp. FA6 TaxID=3413029 RepID=UPI003F65F66C
MEWYLKVLKNYVGFEGRARRTEYWMFTLFNYIALMLLLILEFIANLNSVLIVIYSVAVMLPSLAVAVRRLHDTGRSGWWYLITFIPLIGGIILLIFMCEDSEESNQYGPNPKVFD